MKQCPREFGRKSPIVDILGWGVLALSFVAGIVVLGYIVRWSLKFKPLPRTLINFAGIVTMVAVWLAGFCFALFYFFIRC